MELALIAIVMAVAALWLVLGARNQVTRLASELGGLRRQLEQTQRDLEQARHEHGQTHRELEQSRTALGQTRRDLELLQRELGELKTATEVLPAPPLPKTRTASLDDLREQLRASHREAEPEASDT